MLFYPLIAQILQIFPLSIFRKAPIFLSFYILSSRVTEQDIRRYCASIGEGYTYNKICIDTIKFIDSINLRNLLLLLDEKGIATEDNVGINEGFGNILRYGLIIEHSLAHNKPEILEYLNMAVKSGMLNPFCLPN